MNKLFSIILLLCAFTSSTYANQQDQDMCIAQFNNQCMAKCQETNDINCAQACQDNAINECHEAGQ